MGLASFLRSLIVAQHTRRRISKKIYPDANTVTCANKVLVAVPWFVPTVRPNLNVPPPTLSLPVHMNENEFVIILRNQPILLVFMLFLQSYL